ncbi:MAG: Arm DNA-binding domain-containing protein [Xanthobacteraceae bacterium]
MTTAQRLTDKIVKALPAPERGNVIEYDTETTGFGIRVTAAAARSFVLNYRRKADGPERRLIIGSFPDWSVTAAREQAKRLERDVDSGGDPVGENRAEREAPTVSDLCARFIDEHVAKQSSRTRGDYEFVNALAAVRPTRWSRTKPSTCGL